MMATLSENAGKVRAAVMASVGEHKGAPIALSGGIDSATILAASLDHGWKPECFTFQLLPHESDDLVVAKSMCKKFGLKLHVTQIRREEKVLVKDLKDLLPYAADYLGKAYEKDHPYVVKVPVQCLHPMSYVHRLAAQHGVTKLLTGFCADTYYGGGRQANVMLQKEGLQAWEDYRHLYIVHPINADLLVKTYFADNGIDLVDAWAALGVQDVMFGMGPRELTKPYPKAVTVEAFRWFWNAGNWRRENASLQVVSGIREWHDTLLASPINVRGRRKIVALYADILEGINGEANSSSARGHQDGRNKQRPISFSEELDV